MKKQTAANNALLAAVKKTFNEYVFKRASSLLNTEGREACLAYIGTMYNDEYRVERMEQFNAL